eukprot:gb/GFBE01013307.1/.p1 GENE.gb/GFBE01013307.1/~~gb/GFBE01013307.1/.p1  ORF type:complete len:329 (+),score=21.75 gb/GFBE01013307.1/:1-987(+)
MAAVNQGKPWSYDETVQLLNNFAGGRSCSQLASDYGRTATAIQARLCLLYFGACPDGTGRAVKQNQRWSVGDDEMLFKRYVNRATIEDLSSQFGRSPKSIQLRLLEKAPRSLLRRPSDAAVREMTKTFCERQGLPDNFKSRWTEDDERCIDRQYRVQGRPIDEIATSVRRTSTAVSCRLCRLYFGANGSAESVDWCKDDDRIVLKEFKRSNDLIITAQAVSRKPSHVAFRLLELLPRSKLTLLGAAQVQETLAKAEAARLAGTKRSHSDLESGDHFTTTCCAICMDRQKDVALIPCGHTFCQHCVLRAEMKTCSICRQPVASTLKLHN